MSPAPERKVFAVSELTRRIRDTLEGQIGSVWVEGEVSNLRRPSSGHLYFTLKDEGAQLSAVLFRGDQRTLPAALRDGVQLRVYGLISVYERSGAYQIVVRRVEEAGKGTLQARFEALKAKLLQEGLFDAARKRPLPILPRHIGIVTSPTGAAIRDILQVVSRRFPNLHIVLAPVRVQGEGAAQEIAAAIDLFNARGGLDVLIVGRGGGSLEDLWCFNEEVVARAIVRSAIPVISAVGHEIDFTISDFVADVRAPTPSAAAELVVERKDVLVELLEGHSRRTVRALREAALRARSRLGLARASYAFREPAYLAKQVLQRLDHLELRMGGALQGRLGEGRQCLQEMGGRMVATVRLGFSQASQRALRLEAQLRSLSPLAVLARGYAVVCDSRGRVVRRAAELAPGEHVRARLGEGSFEGRRAIG